MRNYYSVKIKNYDSMYNKCVSKACTHGSMICLHASNIKRDILKENHEMLYGDLAVFLLYLKSDPKQTVGNTAPFDKNRSNPIRQP